jgi:hypothetical protein
MFKGNYLISPMIDFLMIGGLSLFFYFIVIFFDFGGNFDLVFFMFILAFFVNSPHFMISYEIFYSSDKWLELTCNKFFVVGVVIPLILIIIIAIGIIYDNYNSFLILLFLMFFLVGWHYIKQAYGCFIVYSAGNKIFYDKNDQKLLKWSLYPLWIFSFLKIFTTTDFTNFWGFYYDFPKILDGFNYYISILSLLGGAVFFYVVFKGYIKNNKRLNITAIMPMLIIYIWLSPIFFNINFIYMIPFFHSLQYFLFSGSYTSGIIERNNGGIGSWVRWWGGAFVLGVLFFEIIPNYLDSMLIKDSIVTNHLFLISFLFFINIHHYFIDSVIWKGDNLEVRNNLVFKQKI